MKTTLTVNIDSKVLQSAVLFFGKEPNIDYSEVVENALLYFLKPQINDNRMIDNLKYEENLKSALIEPVIDMDEMTANYSFDISKVEGMWPGDEPIEQLLDMLTK